MSTAIKAATAAEATALWWAEQIGAPRFDNGDRTDTGGLTTLLGHMLASEHPVSEDQGRKFAEALTPIIDEMLDRIDEMLDRIDWVSLGVDYGPDLELAKAADVAGISYSRFPWKTNSWIRRSHVTVSAGYRARATLIWDAPDWVRPECGSNRFDEQTSEFFDEVCTLPQYHPEGHGVWRADKSRCAECGGTFSDHYGAKGHARMDRGDFHSWQPEVSA